MKQYMIINDADGNDSFTIEAENSEDAAHKALEQLGWWVAKPEEIEEKNSNE